MSGSLMLSFPFSLEECAAISDVHTPTLKRDCVSIATQANKRM
jgi:hypothetical protein